MERLKPGMALVNRQRLRTEIAERLIRQALERSSATGRSDECRQAMQLTGKQLADPEAAARAHKSCAEEEPGGKGCLCECHDLVLPPGTVVVAPSAVLSGSEEVFR